MSITGGKQTTLWAPPGADAGLSDAEAKNLCVGLMHADSEAEVISLLESCQLWQDSRAWRLLGDNESNFSIVGAQQSRPEAALVEKLVNSIDSRLVNACLVAGIDPEGPKAPPTIREAVARFFDDSGHAIRFDAGRIREWLPAKRTEEGRVLTLAATGLKPPLAPCLTISDNGEGQEPDAFPRTFCSLTRGNKLKIPFVQGKFNMGGTGALQFCGSQNLQLILSRRNPAFASAGESGGLWGFTLIRRENPTGGARSSVYTYLAPQGRAASPGQGGVLRFAAMSMPIFPEVSDNGRTRQAYARHSAHGSLVKLYEYQVAKGLRSNIVTTRNGVLRQVDLLLPEVALPVRVYECRDGYSGGQASFETNVNGLGVRLDDDRASNQEDGFPTSASINVDGESIDLTIYAFTKDPSGKERGKDYRQQQGVVFSINGQSHGHLTVDFFRRKSVGLHYLAESLLLILDCSKVAPRSREDLFMNSRDRLRKNDLEQKIEAALEDLLAHHTGLKTLKAARRQKEISERLTDTKPLRDVLAKLVQDNESLRRILLQGVHVANPFAPVGAAPAATFEGKKHPTFFRWRGLDYGLQLNRSAPMNRRARVALETDVENEYLNRPVAKGKWEVEVRSGDAWTPASGSSLNLHQGAANLSVVFPENVKPGDRFRYRLTVIDEYAIDPFVNELQLTAGEPVANPGPRPSGTRTPPPGSPGGDAREIPSGFALPEPRLIHEDEWLTKEPPFDKYTALRVIHVGEENGVEEYDFQVNVDNLFLKAEQKRSKESPELLERRFVCAMVLVGLGVLQDDRRSNPGADRVDDDGEKEEVSVADRVDMFSRSIAPLLLPMIDGLGSISENDIVDSTGDTPGE